VTIILPDPSARIWVNNFATVSTGERRIFETPALQPNRTYAYQLTVLWQQDGQTMRDERRLEVGAGGAITVDYTRPQVAAKAQ
jgi:uncharacterized protein (TIGR03000 family)